MFMVASLFVVVFFRSCVFVIVITSRMFYQNVATFICSPSCCKAPDHGVEICTQLVGATVESYQGDESQETHLRLASEKVKVEVKVEKDVKVELKTLVNTDGFCLKACQLEDLLSSSCWLSSSMDKFQKAYGDSLRMLCACHNA